MTRFTLIHPSRGRPHRAFNAMLKWVANCSSPVQYILSLDRDDSARPEYYTRYLKMPTHIEGKIIENDNRNLVDAIHKAIPLITGDCIISISDDFDCPAGWDTHLEKIIAGKESYAIRVQNTIVKARDQIITLPILSKSVIDRLGYIYYPEYTGMFADNDLYEVCERLGVVISSFIVFPHNHWVNKKATRDATYNRHNTTASWNHGKNLLTERRKRNFDL